jgi:hypothetical protein
VTLPAAQVEDSPDRNLQLDPAACAAHGDRSPREHPLAEVAQLEVRLEHLEVLCGIRDELLVAVVAVISAVRRSVSGIHSKSDRGS